MCAIVGIVSQKRIDVDGPPSVMGANRPRMPVRRLRLADFWVKIGRGARDGMLDTALEKEETAAVSPILPRPPSYPPARFLLSDFSLSFLSTCDVRPRRAPRQACSKAGAPGARSFCEIQPLRVPHPMLGRYLGCQCAAFGWRCVQMERLEEGHPEVRRSFDMPWVRLSDTGSRKIYVKRKIHGS